MCVCGIEGMQTHQKRILRPGLCLFPLSFSVTYLPYETNKTEEDSASIAI